MEDKASTTGAIKHAVIEAMETKDITEITITQICNACHIARSTFYRYYDSVDDVVKKIGNELLASIERVSAIDKTDSRHKGNLFAVLQSDLARAQILYEYAPFILAVTGVNGDPSYATKAAGLIRRQMQEQLGAKHDMSVRDEFLTEFYIAGTFRIIDYWLRSHPELQPVDMFKLQQQLSEKIMSLAE